MQVEEKKTQRDVRDRGRERGGWGAVRKQLRKIITETKKGDSAGEDVDAENEVKNLRSDDPNVAEDRISSAEN